MSALNIPALAARIRALQDADGRIAWIDDGIWDPWNHAEAAMGLMVAGEMDAAERALHYLAHSQNPDGGWDADMGCAAPMDADNRRLVAAKAPRVVDLNFCAYPATAVRRWSLMGRPVSADMLDMVERALRFVAAFKRSDAALPWRAPEPGEHPDDVDALSAGGASIAFSFECGAALMQAHGRPAGWMRAMATGLRQALRRQPGAFADRARYAMDWYYPVLTGVVTGDAARRRLAAQWEAFVHPLWGCRCVCDEPWATAAETAELVLAASAAGAHDAARGLLESLARHDDGAGGLWMGRQFVENRPWPEERPSWTAGAALMALDAVERLTPGADLFTPASQPLSPEPAPAREAVSVPPS